MKVRGNKHEVYHGHALKTAGGLTRADLTMNARNKVVSKKQSERGKKIGDRLKKHQFTKK